MEVEIHLVADRAVCHSEHSSEYCDLWNATWFFGCKWTACQWSSCATCSIQHGPSGLADDETADAFDSEYDGLYDEVTLEVAIFFSMIFVKMSPIQTKTKQTFLLRQTLKPQTQTVQSFCRVMRGFRRCL